MAEEGVDLIVLEMMRDITYTEIALTAARQTELPVWVGYSTTINDAGQVQLAPSTARPILLAEALQKLAPKATEKTTEKATEKATALVSIMHTLTEEIAPSLAVLNANWSGAVGVYAHSGEFIMPNWQFIDMISPEAYATEAEKWVAAGVKVIGGCCGIGPEHIRVLAERLSASDQQNK